MSTHRPLAQGPPRSAKVYEILVTIEGSLS